MLKAYFDESIEGGILSVAGFVARQDQWRHVEQICFDMFRDHAMPYIHMKDFVSRKSPIYASIPYQDRSSIVRALAGTARRHLPLGILVRINANEYESETTPRFRSQIGSHYTVASIAAVMIVGVLLQQGDIDWSVSWTFEGGHVSKVN
jgi:hypothetical protein